MALAFASVPLHGAPDQAAAGCLAAVRQVTGGAVRVSFPTRPVPLTLGDPADGLAPVFRFPAPEGGGELWLPNGGKGLPRAVREALEVHLSRIWSVQEERAAQAAELDRLRFHLAALQQVARTLS
ncbi:MAG: hypothetical protein M3P24_06540, partial [Gemmatimonadota bacterium]|nr:hypothetical protein [Gemmatimonadota bacterium]